MTAQDYGDYQSMLIDAEDDEKVDYFQFVICQQEGSQICHPSESDQEFFSIGPLEFPDPPPGLLQVRVRGCANPDRLVDKTKPCGPWTTTDFTQVENKNDAIKQAFVEDYTNEKKIKSKGQDLKNILLSLPALTDEDLARMKNDVNLQNYATILESHKNISPQLLGELLSSPLFLDLKEKFSTIEPESLGLAQTPPSDELNTTLALMSLALPEVITFGTDEPEEGLYLGRTGSPRVRPKSKRVKKPSTETTASQRSAQDLIEESRRGREAGQANLQKNAEIEAKKDLKFKKDDEARRLKKGEDDARNAQIEAERLKAERLRKKAWIKEQQGKLSPPPQLREKQTPGLEYVPEPLKAAYKASYEKAQSITSSVGDILP